MNKKQKTEYITKRLTSYYLGNFKSFSDYEQTYEGAGKLCKEYFDYWLNRHNNFDEEIFNKALTIVPFYMVLGFKGANAQN